MDGPKVTQKLHELSVDVGKIWNIAVYRMHISVSWFTNFFNRRLPCMHLKKKIVKSQDYAYFFLSLRTKRKKSKTFAISLKPMLTCFLCDNWQKRMLPKRPDIKFSKSQNEFLVSSNLPKSQSNFWHISALAS